MSITTPLVVSASLLFQVNLVLHAGLQDHGGTLDIEEMVGFLKALEYDLDTASTKLLYDQIDIDGNQEVTFEEFLQWTEDPSRHTAVSKAFLEKVDRTRQALLAAVARYCAKQTDTVSSHHTISAAPQLAWVSVEYSVYSGMSEVTTQHSGSPSGLSSASALFPVIPSLVFRGVITCLC